MDEQRVMIAAKLYEARATLKGLLGDRYDLHMAEQRNVLRAYSDATHRGDVLHAAMEMVRTMQADGVDAKMQMFVVAAAVDLIEEPQPERTNECRSSNVPTTKPRSCSTAQWRSITAGYSTPR